MSRDDPRDDDLEEDRDDDQGGTQPLDADDAELLAAIGGAMAQRGDLLPMTEDEVAMLEAEGVEFEGDLPPSLAELTPRTSPDARSEQAPAASQRVVSLDRYREARPRPRQTRPSIGGYAVAAMLGAAAASLVFFGTSGSDAPDMPAQAPADASSARPAAATTKEITLVDEIQACTPCCAGSTCADAEGENRTCASRRTCIPCDVGDSDDAFAIRLSHVKSTSVIADENLLHMDLCARVAGSPWDCAPATVQPSERSEWRTVKAIASSQDIYAGIELELRARGTKQVFGRWHKALRINPTVLCQGIGIVLESEKEHVGSLSLFLDDAHFVEIATGADVGKLKEYRRTLAFSDVVPSVFERPDGEHVLGVGPLSKAAAERLRWAVKAAGEPAEVVVGPTYVGQPYPLP